MHDIAEFLRTHDPFSGLDEEALERLVERVEVEDFEAGATIFRQGEPSRGRVLVVRRGAIELVEGSRVLDVLGEGELFGHPSMLSGLPFGFEARAQEDSRCYSMAASDVIPLLARRSSLSYLTRSLLQRRGPGGTAAEADVASAEMTQQPARALIRREPVTCAADRPLREVARLMSDENVNSMIVRAESGELGIVTDGDLRSRVVAEGMSVDAPVSEVVSGPLTTVGADAAGADVMLAMLDNDVRQVGVLSPRGELLGVLGGIDLVAAEARTPFSLRREIARARDKQELSEAAQRLRSTVVALHATKLPPQQIGRVISVVADALIRRMIELAIESKGTTPAEFAWLALGSHGRRETVPSSDVDSGMAWEDESEQESSGSDQIVSDGVVGYMRTIAADVEDCIRVVGWRLDPHGVTASGEFSASSMATWRRSIGQWLQNPGDEKVLIASSILLDGRTVYGPADLDPWAILLEPPNRDTLRAIDAPSCTGVEATDRIQGQHRGRELRRAQRDLRHQARRPTSRHRYRPLRGTEGRRQGHGDDRAAAGGVRARDDRARTCPDARGGLRPLQQLRLEHQIQQLETGNEPNDHVDPKELSELTRRYLRDAFHEVAAVQKSLSSSPSR